MPSENIHELLQQADPDRRMAALFAPAETRDRLLVLYAFNQEIARIAEATSQNLIGEMKLTWWRDAVEDLYAETPVVRRHDVTEGLHGMRDLVDRADLLALIVPRFDDISARPFGSLEDILAYVDATSVSLMRMALRVCEAEVPDAQIRAAGRAWGLTGLLRALPHRAAIGRAPVPADRLAQEGGTAAMMAQGLGEEKVASAVSSVREAATASLDAFFEAGRIPAEAVPAVGYVVLTNSYLRRLPRAVYQISEPPSLLGRQLRLSWLSMTGR